MQLFRHIVVFLAVHFPSLSGYGHGANLLINTHGMVTEKERERNGQSIRNKAHEIIMILQNPDFRYDTHINMYVYMYIDMKM